MAVKLFSAQNTEIALRCFYTAFQDRWYTKKCKFLNALVEKCTILSIYVQFLMFASLGLRIEGVWAPKNQTAKLWALLIFFLRPISTIFILWAQRSLCAHCLLFLRCPFSQQQKKGKNVDLYGGNSIFHSIFFWDANLYQKKKIWARRP